MSSHYSHENFFLLNRELSEIYFNEAFRVRYYQNSSLALFDIALGLQQFLAHKSHFGVAKNGSSLIEAISPIWMRNVNPLQVKNDSQHWVEFIESLHAETNFVIWASENEITGEILVEPNLVQEIHQRLSQKRIFSIQICHHVDRNEKLSTYEIRLLRPSIFNDSCSIVVHTEKLKASSQIGAFQNLNWQKNLTDEFFNAQTELEEIKSYESLVAKSKNVYFSRFVETTPRLADRIVLSYSQVNAFAIQTELNLKDHDAFAPSKYPFWILNLWKNWWKESENEILLRGLLVLPVHALRQDKMIIKKINQCVEEFERLGRMTGI